MKKVLSLLMALVMVFSAVQCLSVVSFAAYDESGIFQYDYEDGTVVITGVSADVEGTVAVPSEIDGDTVTAIGDYAFDGCDKITEVILPSTVKVIGDHAFRDCSELASVQLNDTKDLGFRTFENCVKLQQITIPKTVKDAFSSFYHSGLQTIVFESGMTVIPEKICAESTNLKSVTIPQGVTAIGDDAFSDCISLESITIPKGVLSIGYGTFSGCTSLLEFAFPDSLLTIDDYAFKNCRKLVSVEFSNVQELGFRMFENCVKLKQASLPNTLKEASHPFYNSGLETVTFSDGITVIPDTVCAEAKALKNVAIPNTVTAIGDHAFESCVSLEAIEVPEGVTSIGYEAFRDCTSLTAFTFPETLISVDDYAFKNCGELASVDFSNVQELGFRIFENCVKLKQASLPNTLKEASHPFYNSGLETVTFAEEITVIPDTVCAEAKALKNVAIPDTVTAIGDHAFESCVSLEAIEVPEGVTSIGYEAFRDCTSLTAFTFPETLISVDDYAFKNCGELASVDFSNVEKLGFRVFENCSKLKSVCLPNTVKEASHPFYNSGLETAVFEDGIQMIPKYTFAQAKLLKSVTLSQSVTEIGSYAFDDCECMEEIILPQGLMIIGSYAFDGCVKLKKINIPDTVIGIQSNSFKGCSQLAEVTTVKNTTGWKYFENKDVSIIEIPCSHPYNEDTMKQDATCTEPGYTYGLYCPYCEVWVEGHEVIPAVGHIASDPVIENEAAATCTEGGSYDSVVYCAVCNTELSRNKVNTDKLGHSFTNYVADGNATCTEDGTKTAKCDRCNVTDTIADPGSAHGHIAASAVKENVVKATCTANGSYDSVVYCKTCHEELSRTKATTDKIAHKIVTIKATPATCTKTGLTEGKKCSVCGEILTVQTVVSKKAHSYTTTTTKATTSKDGKIVTSCTACGKVAKTVVIAKASTVALSAFSYTYDGKVKTPSVTVKNSKGTALKNGTDYTVTYASGRKNPGQYAVKVTFKGNYSGSKMLYFTILPGVTSKIVTTTSASAVKLTWKAVPGATGYRVYVYNTSTKKYTALKTTTATSYTATNLKSGTSYKFAIKAYTTVSGKVYWSSEYQTVTATTNPGTPTLKVTAGSKNATLSWTKQTGASGYEIYYKSGNTYKKLATVQGGDTLKYTRTGLKTGSTYTFRVRAYSVVAGKTIYGSFSSAKSVKVK